MSISESSTLLNAALDYANRGFYVFPLQPRGKKPITNNGFYNATRDDAIIRAWWSKSPDANIGIRCNDLLVADFDGYEGAESLNRLQQEHDQLPRTWTIKTGGGIEAEPKEQGLHFVYRCPPELNIRPGAGKYGYANLDFRANDSYIVAAPSITRLPYEIIDVSPVADAPDWLITLAKSGGSSKSANSKPSDKKTPHGQRNDYLFRLASGLRTKGLSEDTILDSVRSAYQNDCDHAPPMDDKELTTIAKQAAKYEPGIPPPKAPEYKLAQAGFHCTKLSDLLKEPDEEIAYLWEGILIKGGLSILAAKPKVGKSTLARNLTLRIARGDTEFLGRAITASGPVVYLGLEEKRSEVKKHFERMGVTEELPIFIHVGSAPEKAIEELRKAVTESNAIMAIVDPLQRLVRIPDLNDYSVVSLALEPLMQIARDTGCHLLLIHHATKGINRESGDSILGSTAIFGSVDCALIMKRGESYRTIESIQRYGEDLPRTVLAFDVGMGLTSSGGSLEDVQVAECGKTILELLADHEMTEKEIKDGITDYKGGIVSKSLRLLCQEGKVQRQGSGKKGDPYLYAAVPKNAGDSRDKYIEIPTIPIIGSSLKKPSEQQNYTGEQGEKEIPSILPKRDDPLNPPEAVLGMPVEKALDLWRSEGAPVIHLGPGENCFDLEKLLSNGNVKPGHLEAVRAWLEKVLKRRGESNA